MCATAAFAYVARPTIHLSDEIGRPDLEALFPTAFLDWRVDSNGSVVLPAPDVQAKLNNGDALKIDILNIQANIDNEENRKMDLQNTLQKQLNLLSYTTGNAVAKGVSFDFDVNTKGIDSK